MQLNHASHTICHPKHTSLNAASNIGSGGSIVFMLQNTVMDTDGDPVPSNNGFISCMARCAVIAASVAPVQPAANAP